MSKQSVHFGVAAAVAALTRATKEIRKNPNVELGELLVKTAFSALVGGAGGVLPDLIEPANNPHHRGAFHSVGAGGLLASAHLKVGANPTIAPWQKQLLSDLSIGYGVHLALDAKTPKGLPLVMRNL